jgi:hypothetical protein
MKSDIGLRERGGIACCRKPRRAERLLGRAGCVVELDGARWGSAVELLGVRPEGSDAVGSGQICAGVVRDRVGVGCKHGRGREAVVEGGRRGGRDSQELFMEGMFEASRIFRLASVSTLQARRSAVAWDR